MLRCRHNVFICFCLPGFNRDTLTACLVRDMLMVPASPVSLPAHIPGIRKDIGNILKKRLKETLMNIGETLKEKAVLSTSGLSVLSKMKDHSLCLSLRCSDSFGLKPETFALEAVEGYINPDILMANTKQ